MVLHAIKENFRCVEAFLLQMGWFFKLFSSNIETSCQQNKNSSDKLEISCGTKFLRVLIFMIFAIFPAVRKNNPPPPKKKEMNEKTFPTKIYSRVLNILRLKFTTQKYSTKNLTRTRILSMLDTGYFLKVNSQQEKPMCPCVVNAVQPFFTISQF